MKQSSILFIVVGVILQLLALLPARKICAKRDRVGKGWKFLRGMMIFFVVAYLAYGFLVLINPPSYQSVTISAILLMGAVFVIVVMHMSNSSIERIDQLARMERYRASHDGLTDLPNRQQFQERLEYGLTLAEKNREPLTVLFMDLVRFKDINNSLGHFYGDYILQEVALRLAEVFKRGTGVLARIGSDEFAALIPSMDQEEAVRTCHTVAATIEEPFALEGHNVNLRMSIGIAVYPEHGNDAEILIQHADIAMYVAKHNDVTYAVFDPDQDRSTWSRLVLIGQLREAVKKGQFVLHFQPKICMRNSAFFGVEALARWVKPGRETIPPDTFIPLIEQAGLSKSFTNWVLDEALQQAVRWEQEGRPLNIAVNLSVKNLHDLDFPEDVRRALAKHPIAPERLILEITESCVMIDQERVIRVLKGLRQLGVTLSVDDYGTGYSSIAYLRKFPIQEIKIDKSFVRDMLGNEDNAAIVKSTIVMAHSLGCKVVAEGVEDEATLREMLVLGCDYIQGFHVCKPLSADQLQTWLASTRWHGWQEEGSLTSL